MKPAVLKVKLGQNAQIEISAGNPKEAMEILSAYGEILSESKCGRCDSTNIKPEHRVVDDNAYYNLRCLDCKAQLDFGQHKKGDTLFVKRDKGWYVFQKQQHQGGGQQQNSPAPQSDAPF